MRRSYRPTLELLEDRITPADFFFRSGNTIRAWSNADYWFDVNNQQANVHGATADVFIEGPCEVDANANLTVGSLTVNSSITLGLTVVTHNVSEFSRVVGLAVEDWTIP